MGKVEYSLIDFEQTLRSSFVDSSVKSDSNLAPRIVSNGGQSADNVLSVIKGELVDCTSFDFSVAFLTSSGIQVLVELLNELKLRNIPGRILTSTYLNFNDPEALRKLLEYPNIQTRIYQGSLHAKSYFFDHDQISTIIIGSSNLTQTALTCNKEWNVLFRSFESGGMLLQAKAEFEQLWNDGLCAENTPEWIDEYERFRSESTPATSGPKKPAFRSEDAAPVFSSRSAAVTPNKMQTLALEALDVLHRRSEPRALLVSATGTGKTYLSAFDVLAQQPAKVLFVAHRMRILEASQKSFEHVLGDRYSYGTYGAGSGKPTATCVFAMVSSLSRHLDQFDPDEFDYIIFDEAHRTGANSYQAILDYFTPKFCMGMTATPSRTDGYDVYGLFNHVIAFRITLQDALDEEMLAPFHYFGIADLAIDDEAVDDVNLFGRLTSEERVRHVISKIEEYTVEKKDRRGLIFCNRNEEAAELSRMFNERGYRTVAISGANNDEERNRQIARLEAGEIEYIFSVDILNEGVDIPSLNQIIMLRRTESAIVFVQQLGRGLRKCEGKDFTLVLDFIGNYKQNYLVPIALSGDRTYNKDNLRRAVKEGSTVIPGCSTISFDRVSEAHIFKALEEGQFSAAKLLREEYQQLKQVLGRQPRLMDFDANEALDPVIIFKKYGSYAAFLQKHDKDCAFEFDGKKLGFLKFISQKLANGKRGEDLLMLRDLVSGAEPIVLAVRGKRVAAHRVAAAVNMLSGSYSTAGEELVVSADGNVSLSSAFAAALGDTAFRDQVLQAIEFGLSRSQRLYSGSYKDTDFVLNAKYSREEVCKLLRWETEPNYQNVGGYFHDKQTNTFPVFINYDKDPSISITTQYEDRFVSDRRLIAISKSKRTLNSPEIVNLRNADANGMRCFLFIRKNTNDKDDGTEFYFLGEMHPTGEFEQFVMRDSHATAVEITYELEDAVRPDLYDYFLSDFDGAG